MIASFLDMRVPLGPGAFLRIFVLLSALGVLLAESIWRALLFNEHLTSLAIFLGILVGIGCFAVLLTQAIRRVNQQGRPGILSLACVLPFVAVILAYLYGPAALINSGLIIFLVLGLLGLGALSLPARKS